MQMEGYQNSLQQSIFLLCSFYLMFLLAVFTSTITLRFVVSFVALSILCIIPPQLLVFEFGFISSWLTSLFLSLALSKLVGKLPAAWGAELGLSACVTVLYILSQLDYILYIGLSTAGLILVILFRSSRHAIFKRSLANSLNVVSYYLAFFLMLNLFTCSFYQGPVVCYLKLVHNTISYTNQPEYFETVMISSLLSFVINGSLAFICLVIISGHQLKRTQLQKQIDNHFELLEPQDLQPLSDRAPQGKDTPEAPLLSV